MAQGSDRKTRQFPRFEVNVLVDLTGTEVLLYHKVSNISLGGLCLQSPNLEEVGTVVDLVLNFSEFGAASVAVQGEVVWVNREPPADMGIRFIGLDEPRRAVLKQHLERVRTAATGG